MHWCITSTYMMPPADPGWFLGGGRIRGMSSKYDSPIIPAILDDNTECWNWDGPITRSGYGRVGGEPAHRWVYRKVTGDLPEFELDHLCRNPRCVNPQHIEPVTHAQNMERAKLAHTHCKNGYLFTAANEKIWFENGRSYRRCRTCANISLRKWWHGTRLKREAATHE